jgi:hypothetical protein
MNSERTKHSLADALKDSTYDFKLKHKPLHHRSRSNITNVLKKICNYDDDYVTRLNFFEPNKQQKKTVNIKRNSIIELVKSSGNKGLIREILATNNEEDNLKKVSKKIENLGFELKTEEKRKSLEKLKQENKRELIKSYNEIETLKRELNEMSIEKDLLHQRFNIIENEATRKVRKSVRMSHEEYENYITVRKSMEVNS